MKFSFRKNAVALLFPFVLCLCARAQSLTVTDPEYTSRKLFDSTANHVITGMASDGMGNVYYIETHMGGTQPTRLYKRSGIDYGTVTELYDFDGNSGEGSFLVFSNGKLYFGESINGNIYSINTNGTGLDPLGVIASSYDASVYNGNLFVLHGQNFDSDSRLSSFSLVDDGSGGKMLGAEDIILNATGDYRGSFEYAGGDLYYGASGYGTKRGLYKFEASELGGGPLTPDAEHLWGAMTTNHVSGLALDGDVHLWKTGNPGTDLVRFSVFNTGADPIGEVTGSYSLGQLDFVNNALYLNLTDVNAGRSAVYTLAVPEPSSMLALLAGGLIFTRRRR